LNAPPLNKDAKKKGKDKEDKEDRDKSKGDGFQHLSNTVNVIFEGDFGFPSKRAQKLTLREIMAIEPATPRPLRWSETPFSFSRED
jgi:hypothetical protein